MKTFEKIKKLDLKMKDLSFEVLFRLNNLHLGLTGDRDDLFISNQSLIEFEIEN